MKLKNNKQIFILKELFQEVFDYVTEKNCRNDELFLIYQEVFLHWLYNMKDILNEIKIGDEINFTKYEVYSFYQIILLAKKEKYNISIYDIKNSHTFQKNIKELGIFDKFT